MSLHDIRPYLAKLDRLTDGLPEAAAATALAAQRLADGLGKPARCPWCLEDAGWCRQTGGPNPCEGYVDAGAFLAELDSSPTVPISYVAGGAA